MKVGERDLRAVWWDGPGGRVAMIDQRVLPHRFEIAYASSVEEVAEHIRAMTVRGAPTIGATAAYGMVFGADDPGSARATLGTARPTAHDLFAALEWMGDDPTLARAQAYADDVVERCRRIGEHGARLLERHAGASREVKALTHCNAGALAAVDHGTALSAFHHLAAIADPPVRPFVWVDETRPRLQGALTAWELRASGVPHRVIVDSGAGALMARGEVDLVIVGADRIAANGDTANKIGTATLAVLAKEFGIPFYVAAPCTTFDFSIADGKTIPIEERDADEVRTFPGSLLHPEDTPVGNPAFDVTLARYIAGFVTEFGVLSTGDLDLVRQPVGTAVPSR